MKIVTVHEGFDVSYTKTKNDNIYMGYGCRTSLADTEYIKTITDNHLNNSIFINVCCVVEHAYKHGVILAKLLVDMYPDRHIFVCGCGVNYNNGKDFINIGKNISLLTTEQKYNKKYYGIKDTDIENARYSSHIVKIQEGCVNKCSYCCIPRVRTVLKSYSYDEISKQISEANQDTIYIVGTEITAYECDGMDFMDLLHKLVLDFPDKKIVLESMLPSYSRMYEVIDLIYNNPKNFVPHFPISVQVLSDVVLKAMNRPYTVKRVRELRDYCKERDIEVEFEMLIGSPAETEEEYYTTLSNLKNFAPDYIATNYFSPRYCTDDYSDNVDKFEESNAQRSKKINTNLFYISEIRDIDETQCVNIAIDLNNSETYNEYVRNDELSMNEVVELYGVFNSTPQTYRDVVIELENKLLLALFNHKNKAIINIETNNLQILIMLFRLYSIFPYITYILRLPNIDNECKRGISCCLSSEAIKRMIEDDKLRSELLMMRKMLVGEEE